MPLRRRRLAVAGIVAGSLVLAGTAAAATGIVPGPVQEVFEQITGWRPAAHVDPESAALVATTTFEGTTYEYWSTGAAVPRCEYLRWVRVGERDNGWQACLQDRDPFGDPDLYVTSSSGPGDQMTVAGHARRGAAVVVLTSNDGNVLRVPVQREGFFVAAFSRRDYHEPSKSIETFDAEGNLLQRRDY